LWIIVIFVSFVAKPFVIIVVFVPFAAQPL